MLELAELRYRGGVSAYLEVLDAQRSLFNAELDEAQTIGSHLISLVRLYKALGGGWPTSPEATTAPPRPEARAVPAAGWRRARGGLHVSDPLALQRLGQSAAPGFQESLRRSNSGGPASIKPWKGRPGWLGSVQSTATARGNAQRG